MRSILVFVLAATLVGCGGGGSGPSGPPPPGPTPTPSPAAAPVYQPLAVGDTWTYRCNASFSITNAVTQTVAVGATTTYALAVQIPSSPTASTTETMLVANDAGGNTVLYGYLAGGKAVPVTPATIVSAAPVLDASYDYPGPSGGTVTRTFVGFENSHRTPYGGVYVVAPYFESGGTHNYGYALGVGVVEEDHGPAFEFDCLLSALTLH